MADLSLQQQYILQLFTTAIFYGIYVVVFTTCIYILIFRKSQITLNKPLMLITGALFTISTAQTILVFLTAFLTTDDLSSGPYPGETKLALREQNINNLIDCMQGALTTTNTLLADGLLIWRCFVLWDRRFSIILTPIVMLVAGSVCGYISAGLAVKLYLMELHIPVGELLALPEWTRLEKLQAYLNAAFYATSFVTNVIMTLLIVRKIWHTVQIAQGYFGDRSVRRKYLGRVASLIVESGAIYSACLLITAVLGPLTSTTTALIWDVVCVMQYQLVGILPTLIVVLIALGKSSAQRPLAWDNMCNPQSGSLHTLDFVHPYPIPNARRGIAERQVCTIDLDMEMTGIMSRLEDADRGVEGKADSPLT